MATTVVMKGAALEKWLEGAISDFAARFPGDIEKLKTYVDTQSKNLVRCSGMSTGGTIMVRMFIPARLFVFLRELAARELNIDDLFRDSKIYDTIKRLASDMAPRTRPTPFFDLGAKPKE